MLTNDFVSFEQLGPVFITARKSRLYTIDVHFSISYKLSQPMGKNFQAPKKWNTLCHISKETSSLQYAAKDYKVFCK